MQFWRKPLDADTIRIAHGEIHILRDQCKGCGFCVEYCPREVLKLSDEFNRRGYHPPVVLKADACVYCQLCEILCPEFSIFVTSMNGAAAEVPAEARGREVIVGES